MQLVTARLLLSLSKLRWKHTSGQLAARVAAWQKAGCPDLPTQDENEMEHIGGAMIEILDQIESRAKQTSERVDLETSPPYDKFAFLDRIENLTQDACLLGMTDHQIMDTLLLAVAKQARRLGDNHPRRSIIIPAAIASLRMHIEEMAALDTDSAGEMK